MPSIAPSLAPSLDDLRSAIEGYQDRLARAPYIDSTRRMQAEETLCRERIADLRAQIARLEESL